MGSIISCTSAEDPGVKWLGNYREALERLREELATIFAGRTRDEWEQRLAGLEVCCEPVLELDEVAAHPQIAARGLVREFPTGVEIAPHVPFQDDWRRRSPPRSRD